MENASVGANLQRKCGESDDLEFLLESLALDLLGLQLLLQSMVAGLHDIDCADLLESSKAKNRCHVLVGVLKRVKLLALVNAHRCRGLEHEYWVLKVQDFSYLLGLHLAHGLLELVFLLCELCLLLRQELEPQVHLQVVVRRRQG